ncbi:MAG: aldehyde oxidase and xanthine dehydrogenase molybdopterin binding protein [Pseudonocardiales bacterium]|nr:aldehyde oxidase and xanthine dehydrogenase molybdopterin binding protein [Pseudonocardiales bacterium]
MSNFGSTPPRREDVRLLTGRRRSVGDITLPDQLDIAFARSDVAHARLTGVDVTAARNMPGVHGAFTAQTLPLPMVPPFDGQDTTKPWPPLATDRIRYYGEQFAVVAAEDRYLAEDACDLVRARHEPLTVVIDPRDALLPGAVALWGDGNLLQDHSVGDPVDDVLATAPVVVEASYRQQLLLHTSLEARAILVRPDEDGGITVWVSHQGQHIIRDALAGAFDLDPRLVRVIVPDVGGAFGGKSGTWSEYLVAVGVALKLQRPVRWLEDRREAIANGPRGRGQWQHVRLAAGEDGTLRALDLDIVADIGGYPAQGATVPHFSALVATGCYALDRAHVRVRTVTTNTAPTSAYRGAGRPEAAYQIERTMDLLARRLNIDPAELRRRNFLPSEAFPHTTPTGAEYDSGDYAHTFDILLEMLNYDQARAEQAALRASPETSATLMGIGVACYVERSGGAPHSPEYGALEVTPSGEVVAYSGSTATGQSHETVFPQVVAEVLGIDQGRIRLVQRDTREVREGHGSFGSRSMQVGGGALWRAGETLIRLARERAAALWGIEVQDIAYDKGVIGCGERTVELGALSVLTGPLRAEDVFKPPQAFPFGCYGAIVDVDPGLGTVSVRRLVAVDDYGRVVNPVIVHGQTIGSIAQGLGQALYENATYDSAGRPEQRTLLDYLVPTVVEMPLIVTAETETLNPNQPFGAKGAGEAGCIGTPPAVLNAIADALQLSEPDRLPLPATPEAVWTLLHNPAAGRLPGHG